MNESCHGEDNAQIVGGAETAPPEPYRALCARLGLTRGLPYSRNWSAAPDFLELIVAQALTAKPAVVVECGSGLTTLMLARCCAINGIGKVFSLENGACFATGTRAWLQRYGLEHQASVLDTPLVRQAVDGGDYQWYDLAGLPKRRIDMLVIDGPPGLQQQYARYPALPRLWQWLAEDAVVFLDDAARQDEREIVARWQARYPALVHGFVDNERGASILRRRPDQPGEAL